MAKNNASAPAETTAAPAPGTVTALNRMSVKDLNLKPTDARKLDAGKSMFLFRVVGIITEAITKIDERTQQEYTYFVGEFNATTKDGVFESSKLFLPGKQLEEKMVGEVGAANGQAVEFGYDIFALSDPEGKIGYKYASKSIIKSAVSDRLAAMASEVKALPLPV